MKILTPISLGELYDKLSILEIKIENMDNPEKITNVTNEYDELLKVAEHYPIDMIYYKRLLEVNKLIWDIEDNIRTEELNKDWGEDFIQLARSVYINNDERAIIKKEINLEYGSELVEEKSYAKY